MKELKPKGNQEQWYYCCICENRFPYSHILRLSPKFRICLGCANYWLEQNSPGLIDRSQALKKLKANLA